METEEVEKAPHLRLWRRQQQRQGWRTWRSSEKHPCWRAGPDLGGCRAPFPGRYCTLSGALLRLPLPTLSR